MQLVCPATLWQAIKAILILEKNESYFHHNSFTNLTDGLT